MKYKLLLFAIVVACFHAGLSSCQRATISSSSIENKEQTRLILFLTLKVYKTDNSFSAELIEKKIKEDYNNPLGLNASEQGDSFRCQILNNKGVVIYTSLKKFDFSFKSKDDTPYAILKFSESLPEGYYSCVVSTKISDGLWQELYKTRLLN